MDASTAAKPVGPPVVALCASAGGLTALRQFFATIGSPCGLAFVVIVHLSPDHPSLLAEVLQPSTTLPVQQVTGDVELVADHVYVIPPACNLSAVDTHLRLSAIEQGQRARAPIDHFLRTLAKTHDGHSIAVIFSGMGSDGSLGLREIKERGGLTIVQDPTEAEFDGMPHSAIATGFVDRVLPIHEMAATITSFVAIDPRLVVATSDDVPSSELRHGLQRLFALVRARTGRDFLHYKRATILRRVTRRMQIARIATLSEYLERLSADANEVSLLADDLLVTVTSFFRDREMFEKLEAEIVPTLFDPARTGSIRVWCVGCSSGEEAYSVAMLLLEAAATVENPPQLQVFASDLHELSLEKARRGFFPGEIALDVREDRIARFFKPDGGGYRIRKEVREIVVFTPHNVLADPPFSRVDLVVCRNLLIYLQRDIQREVIELFHYALKPGGVLVLGSSETIEGLELFTVVHKKEAIYRARDVPVHEPRLPVFPGRRPALRRGLAQAERVGEPLGYGTMHQRMVEAYAPPSMLVSPDDKIIHLSEHAGQYLAHTGGELTANAIKLVREELRVELRTALHFCRERGIATRSKVVGLSVDGVPRDVVLQVRPALDPNQSGFVLVIFEDQPPARASDERPPATTTSPGGTQELETELDLTSQRLQLLIEEFDGAQEEMTASNEELQSANEELRSTMEELETSKEELQSMNEELKTVNQENRHKVEELTQLSDDLQNLLAATDIATLFLDRELRILRFTPKVGELFNMRLADHGRPISDLTHRLGYTELRSDAETVLRRLVPLEREVQDESGRWYLTRVLPYRSSDDHIAGIVITFVDITRRATAEQSLRTSEESYRLAVDAGRVGTWDLDLRSRSCLISPMLAELVGCPHAAALLELPQWLERIASDDRARIEDLIDAAEREGTPFDVTFKVVGPDGVERWLYSRGGPVSGEADSSRLHGACIDITERQMFDTLKETDRRKDDFLAMLGHELRNPLAPLQAAVAMMGESLPTGIQNAQLVAVAERQLGNLRRIVDDLLDVARVMRGKITLQKERVDLGAAAGNALTSLGPTFERKHHSARIVVPDEPVFVEADAVRLDQIIVNLLENAAKYTPPEGRIAVSVARDGDQAELRVVDNGVGLAPELIPRVFDLFSQGHQDLARSAGGLGIGLAVVRRLVELHGGTVGVTSEGRGQGSAFVVRLPTTVQPNRRTNTGPLPQAGPA